MTGSADDTMAEELIQGNPNDTTVRAATPPIRRSLLERWRDYRQWVEVACKDPGLKVRGKPQNDGIENTDNTRNRYVAFRGVPYAHPPLGELRFQATEPLPVHKPWMGVYTYKAFDNKQPCVQRDGDKDADAYGEEDCLYMNIYLPREPKKIRKDSPLPVLVFFHGGTHEDVTPDAIMKHDLIFITVNYRVGPVGFLNMQTQSCRGNMGLKDQVQALRFIQDNIKRFRGDPNNVTISGHGASATCVNFHLVSPKSQGLFHKAIVSGGGIFCPFGFKGHRREFQEIIKQVTGKDSEEEEEDDQNGDDEEGNGKDKKNGEEVKEEDTLEYKARKVITDLFMDMTPEQFIRCTKEIMDDYVEEDSKPTELTAYLGPSVEIAGLHTFITEPVDKMMEKAVSVPILAGIAKNEGNQVYIGLTAKDLADLVENDDYFTLFLEQHFKWKNDEAKRRLWKIRKEYFGLEPEQDEKIHVTPEHYPAIEQGLVDLHTDISHRRFYDNFRFGEKKELPKELYVYEFDYYDQLNEEWQREMQGDHYRNDRVAGYGDELLYLYCPKRIRDRLGTFNADVVEKINQMCTLWANFCITGVPKIDNGAEEIKWRPHSDNDPCHLHIGKDLKMIKGRLNEARWDMLATVIQQEPLWDSLQTAPETPAPPTLLMPNWVDPELDPKIDEWLPKPSRKGSGASSVLTRRTSKSSKSGSRRPSHRSSVSSNEHTLNPDNAGMSIAATARNFGVSVFRRLSGYRTQSSESDMSPGDQPRSPTDSGEELSQPGPSWRRDSGPPQTLPESEDVPPSVAREEALPHTPSHAAIIREHIRLQSSTLSTSSVSSHDDSIGPLIRAGPQPPRPRWWKRIAKRSSDGSEETSV